MLAYDILDDYEIIEGVKFMAPGPDMGHVNISANLSATIGAYAKANRLGIFFPEHMDVHFPDGNVFQPDFVFVSMANKELFIDKKNMALHGVPDMVAEVFSRSTMKRDVGIKKDVYERNGVKEYWMIDPWRETIDVYLLRDGKYELDEHYENWSEDQLLRLPEEERAEIKREIPVAVLDSFTVKIKNIFGWVFE